MEDNRSKTIKTLIFFAVMLLVLILTAIALNNKEKLDSEKSSADAYDHYDLDGDGEMTISDFTEFITYYRTQDQTIDFNDDGSVNIADFVAFAYTYKNYESLLAQVQPSQTPTLGASDSPVISPTQAISPTVTPTPTLAPQSSCNLTCESRIGFNPGVFIPDNENEFIKYLERSKKYGLNSLLFILVGDNLEGEIERSKMFVRLANQNCVTPIIRLCVKDDPKCQVYKDYRNLVKLIDEVSKVGEFAIIAGPNEPNREPWLYAGLPGITETEFWSVLAEYTSLVAKETEKLPSNQRANVKILTPTFDMTVHHDWNGRTLLYQFFGALEEHGGISLIDGVSMNLYSFMDVSANDRWTMVYLEVLDDYIAEYNWEIYAPEFGSLHMGPPDAANADAIKQSPHIKSLLMFTPFSDLGNPDPAFEMHHFGHPDEAANVTHCPINN